MVQASSPHRFVTWPYRLNRKDRIILLTTTQFSEWTMWTGPFAFFCTEEWMILPVTPSIRYIPTKVRSWCVSVLSVTTASRFGFKDYSSRKRKKTSETLAFSDKGNMLICISSRTSHTKQSILLAQILWRNQQQFPHHHTFDRFNCCKKRFYK